MASSQTKARVLTLGLGLLLATSLLLTGCGTNGASLERYLQVGHMAEASDLEEVVATAAIVPKQFIIMADGEEKEVFLTVSTVAEVLTEEIGRASCRERV